MSQTATLNLNKKSQSKKTKRPYVLAAIMLAMFTSAVEGTIVSTAMPAIVADLGGFSLYSWVFSSYLLMTAVTTLIYGKLSDLFGRKPILIFGLTIFLFGSILCGFAKNITMLIVFRFIQGFGAGAVMPISSTIVGDIYTLKERAKVQGYLSSVWGISAIVGPALGGIFVQYLSWRFVFWVNIPLCLFSMIGLFFFLHEGIEKKKHQIDYAGAILLTISISSLMFVLVEGGVRWSWGSMPIMILVGISLITLILFVIQETKAAEPMMPFDIWKERSILIANITSLTTGVILIGLSTFLPTFVQGVMGGTAIVAGFTLTTMSIGWPIASTVAGNLLLKIGFRSTSIIGGISLTLGGIVFILLSANTGPIWAAFGSFLIGVGMGLSSTAFIVSIQSTVSFEKRGIATASNMFMRTVGSTIGAALLGGILNSQLASYIESKGLSDEANIDMMNMLLDENKRNQLSNQVVDVLQHGLATSLHDVFIVLFIFAAVSLLFILFFPKSDISTTK